MINFMFHILSSTAFQAGIYRLVYIDMKIILEPYEV